MGDRKGKLQKSMKLYFAKNKKMNDIYCEKCIKTKNMLTNAKKCVKYELYELSNIKICNLLYICEHFG